MDKNVDLSKSVYKKSVYKKSVKRAHYGASSWKKCGGGKGKI